MGDLIFLDEYRIGKEQEELDICDKMHIYTDQTGPEALSLYMYEDDYYADIHYDCLTSTDIATLTEDDIRWIIKQLLQKSDFYKHKEDALSMIEDVLQQREEDY